LFLRSFLEEENFVLIYYTTDVCLL